MKNCKVAVVGGAGFLGSHLVEHLIEDRGCDVLVMDNLCVGRREFVHPRAEFHHADITKSEAHLRNAFTGCRFVFNYAAWPYIPDSFRRPLHVFEVNATGAIQVINAAQEAGCEGVLQVSSAEIYGDGDVGSGTVGDNYAGKAEDGTICGFKQLNEHSLVRPHSTYGVAKAAVDSYVQTAWKERRTPCIALRQFNCLGERETHPYVVPEIISQLSKQHGVAVNGYREDYAIEHANPGIVKLGNNSFRDFMYAGDAVRIAVELLERGEFGGVYNLGSEGGVKVYNLAKLIGNAMGFVDVTVEKDESRVRPWEIWHLQSDNSKLALALEEGAMAGLTSLEEALKRTVAWFERNGRRWPWEK